MLIVFFYCTTLIAAVASYKAAVVEFRTDSNHLSPQYVQNNLIGFEKVLKRITAEGGAQIVVFPENAILGVDLERTRKNIYPYLEVIPTPQLSNLIPCSDAEYSDRPILTNLSCFARNYNVVLVANMGEVQHCSGDFVDCPKDGHFQFNTNVVFENDGRLIAKYQKQHLYDIENNIFDPGSQIYSSIAFNTSFGVTFGTLTCLDILHKEPGSNLVSTLNVKNFILPLAWGNNFPFHMSLVVEQSWSLKHQVNLLAANLQYSHESFKGHSRLAYYSSGSGIYSSGRAIHYYISDINLSSAMGDIIIAEVPKDPERSNTGNDNGKVLHPENIKSRTSTYLTYRFLEHSNGVIEVTHKYLEKSSITCRLEYSIQIHGLLERYALGAFIGVKPRDQSFGYAACVIVKCRTSNIQDCGSPIEGYSSNTLFNSLHISGTFPNDSEVYAGALGSGLKLLQPDLLKVSSNSLTIIGYDRPLLSASLWAKTNLKDYETEECDDKAYDFTVILASFIVACIRLYDIKFRKQNSCKN